MDSDYEPEEQDIGMLTEDEEEEVPVKKRRDGELNKGFPANDKRGTHIRNVLEFLSYYKKFMGVF